MTRRSPKFLVITYTTLTCVLSWSFLLAVKAGLPLPVWTFLFTLMWIPAAVSTGLRLAFREGFVDAGFRAGALRYWALACGIPLALATLTYGIAWAFQQVQITPYLKQQSMFGPEPFRLVWLNANAGTAGLLAQRFAVVVTLGIALGFVFGLGEEIGWRGYLLPKLVQSGVRFPILISGLIWGAWHVPFVLLTFQHQRYVTAVLYALACIVFAVFISWLRLASGSVFVAGMAHGAYNTFFQDFFDHSFVGPHKWFWAGEVGLLCSITFGAFAFWLYRTKRIALVLAQSQTMKVPSVLAS
jgi:membrane protease YdiL (CAAX protease family)